MEYDLTAVSVPYKSELKRRKLQSFVSNLEEIPHSSDELVRARRSVLFLLA